jgi:hypothetical protein
MGRLSSAFKELFGPKKTRQVRMYHAAKQSASRRDGADDYERGFELSTSIRVLRARSRQLIRDAAYAKRAKVIVVNNIVGAGSGCRPR